jgi:hypothetical protein
LAAPTNGGKPVRSLYNFRVLLRLWDEHGFHLAEECFWHNPAKLPSPIEWVNKRKIGVKDSVSTVCAVLGRATAIGNADEQGDSLEFE